MKNIISIMNLYRIEYIIKSTGQKIICFSVGRDQGDVVKDIFSVVGSVTVLSIVTLSEVHRLTGTIRRHVQNTGNTRVRRGGRPRKYDPEEV